MEGTQHPKPLTVEEVFSDFRGRRAALIKALTTDVKKFYHQCSPEKENLCLYGLPNEAWEVNLPADEVPPELPEPALGINFPRDGMAEKDWLSLIAAHSDSWLISMAFYIGARFGFGKNERERLFQMINDLPTIFEVVSSGNAKQSKAQSARSRGGKPRRAESRTKSSIVNESVDKEEDEERTVCGACGNKYDDKFWIGCDACEKWFHGKCVKITKAKSEHIKDYKCPSCSTSKKIKS